MSASKLRKVRLRDATSRLSALLDKAERGEPSIIFRHGRPAAIVLGYEDWRRQADVPSFARLLLAAPSTPDDLPERDTSPLREIGF